MSKFFGDSDEDFVPKAGKNRPRRTKEEVAGQPHPVPVPRDPQPDFPLKDEMENHLRNIKTGGSDATFDYLRRLTSLASKGPTNFQNLHRAIQSYEQYSQQQPLHERIPLFLPNGYLNPQIFDKTPPSNWANQSLLDVAISSASTEGSPVAAIRILQCYVNNGYELDSEVIGSLLTSRENYLSPDLRAFLQSHLDLFDLNNPAIPTTAFGSVHVKCLETQESDEAANKAIDLISTNQDGLKDHLDDYIKEYKYPLINSCGYITSGVCVTTEIHPQTKAKTTHLAFNYRHDQSLFRLAFHYYNTKAIDDLISHFQRCKTFFPKSSVALILYDALSEQQRGGLDFIPKLVETTQRSYHSQSHKMATFDHFIKHPITGKSIFEAIFKCVLDLQHLQNEFEVEKLSSLSSLSTPFLQQTMISRVPAEGNMGSNPTQTNFSPQHGPHSFPIKTSLYIFDQFMKLLQTAVFTIMTVSHLLVGNAKPGQFCETTKTALTRHYASLKILHLFRVFESAADQAQSFKTHCDEIQQQNQFQPNQNQNESPNNTPFVPVNLVEEFLIATLIQFVPYLSPKWLIRALDLPGIKKYPNLLQQLLPKLPSHYFRTTDSLQPFPAHKILLEFCLQLRSKMSSAGSVNGASVVVPQLLMAAHLRLPTHIPARSQLLNTHPSNQAGVSQGFNSTLASENSVIEFWQKERLAIFQTQLTNVQRHQVHPMVLLKFHPVAILQALYLYSDVPGAAFFSNPLSACLLTQLNKSMASFESRQSSSLTRLDSFAFKALTQNNNAVIPTQLLPLLTPTLYDCLYYCRSRNFANLSERAFYNKYYFDLLENTCYVKGDKDSFVAVLSQGTLHTVEEMISNAQQWAPPVGYPMGPRLLSDDFMDDLQLQVANAKESLLLETGIQRYLDGLISDDDIGEIICLGESTKDSAGSNFSEDSIGSQIDAFLRDFSWIEQTTFS